MTDLYNTSNCPPAAACATCGGTDGLHVATAITAVGLLCLTVCPGCAGAGTLPPLPSWTVAIEMVWAHCAHLGISPDDMAELLRQEENDG